jgi:hypothetical protein
MLLKITNQCGGGCRHCMEDSRPNSQENMTVDNFLAALDCTDRVESAARIAGYNAILLSGGECTEHPQFLDYLEIVERKGFYPMVLTRGQWIGTGSEIEKEILRPGRKLMVQVTFDKRYYPHKINSVPNDPRISYTDEIGALLPLGRAARLVSQGTQSRTWPVSFNLRSFVHKFRDIVPAIALLRMRAMAGKSGHCTPAIDWQGNFLVGESIFCHRAGTVYSSNAELTEAILQMGSCDKCGLEKNLSTAERAAVGLKP